MNLATILGVSHQPPGAARSQTVILSLYTIRGLCTKNKRSHICTAPHPLHITIPNGAHTLAAWKKGNMIYVHFYTHLFSTCLFLQYATCRYRTVRCKIYVDMALKKNHITINYGSLFETQFCTRTSYFSTQPHDSLEFDCTEHTHTHTHAKPVFDILRSSWR